MAKTINDNIFFQNKLKTKNEITGSIYIFTNNDYVINKENIISLYNIEFAFLWFLVIFITLLQWIKKLY